MSDPVVLLDPTAEVAPVMRERIARPPSLDGMTVALLDIAKPRGDEFLDRIAERLAQRGLKIERFRKPRFSVVAPDDLRQEIGARCQAVIEALAD
jgi:hypothetical protein